MSQSSLLANLLDRRAVVSTMLRDRKGIVAVGGLGASTNDMAAAALTVSTRSSAVSARSTLRPIASSAGCVARLIGTCQGLNSAHSPRMVTSISSGKRPIAGSDSMLMQLPTPLDCISRTERCPPSQAPAAMAMPSSSVVSTLVVTSRSAENRRMS